jgi:Ca2+/H+ antiporter
MKAIGRALQVIGLTIPPLAIVAELAETISLGQMLAFLVAAACSFWIGRITEGYSGP